MAPTNPKATCGTHNPVGSSNGSSTSDDHHIYHKDNNNDDNNTSRRRRAEEPWFGDDACYTNDDTKRKVTMGIVMTKKLYDAQGGTMNDAVFYVANMLASTNLIYEMQMNIVLSADGVLASDGTETFDNTGCTRYWKNNYPDLEAQLAQFTAWTKPSKEALWHLLDDCWAPPECSCNSGTSGLASLGVLCNTVQGNGLSYEGRSVPPVSCAGRFVGRSVLPIFAQFVRTMTRGPPAFREMENSVRITLPVSH